VEGTFKVDNNANYGIIVDIPIERLMAIEIYWSHMNSTGHWDPYATGITSSSYDMGIDYFQIGAMKQADLGTGDLKGFGTLTLGAVYFNIKDPEVTDVWRFAATLGGGLKYYISDRIGLRVQGRLLMPMYWGSAGFYCGIGTGGSSCGAGVSSTTFLVQGDIIGGLVISLGD
jgi:hypothetical protein